MEFVNDRSQATINRSINIIDGPVIPHPSSGTGKKIRVMQVQITFTLKDDEWVIRGWTTVQISGVVLKKDGTEGKETWLGTVHYCWQKMPEYAWLDLLIDAVRPEGVPQLPFRLTGIDTDDLEAG